jgi:hypothetical protein
MAESQSRSNYLADAALVTFPGDVPPRKLIIIEYDCSRISGSEKLDMEIPAKLTGEASES